MNAYKIANLVNGRQYVGITIRLVKERFRSHLWRAEKGGDGTLLANAIRKHGRAAFSVEHIASARTEADLVALEILLIAQEKTLWTDGGYNLTIGGEGRRGGRRTPEEIEKVAAKLRGRARPPEIGAAVSAYMKGRKKSRNHVLKMAHSKIGSKKTPEQIEASASFHRGRKRTDETKARMSAAAIGNTNGRAQAKPICGNGHPMEGDNVYWYRIASGAERRCCLECARESSRVHYWKTKGDRPSRRKERLAA